MTVGESLDVRRCSISLRARDKAAALDELAELMASGSPLDAAQIRAALQAREAEGSTGFENGVAIPHARLPGDVPFLLAVAVSKKGVAFDSVDGKRSKLFFVLIGPDAEPQDYLRALAHISRLGLDAALRKELIGCHDESALLEVVRRNLAPTRGDTREAAAEEREAPARAQALLVVVLSDPGELDDMMTLFLQRGVEGASVFESRSMGATLGQVPLFGSLMDFLGEGGGASRTIISMLPAADVRPLVASIEKLFGDLDRRSGIAVMAADLSLAKGSLGTI